MTSADTDEIARLRAALAKHCIRRDEQNAELDELEAERDQLQDRIDAALKLCDSGDNDSIGILDTRDIRAALLGEGDAS